MAIPFPPVQATRSVPSVAPVNDAGSLLLLAANTARIKFWVQYPLGSPGTLYVTFGGAASDTTMTLYLQEGDSYQSDIAEFNGDVYGRLSAGAGAAFAIITEES